MQDRGNSRWSGIGRWRVTTWLVVGWSAIVATLGMAALLDPENDIRLVEIMVVVVMMASLWCVGMVLLGLLWIAAYLCWKMEK